MVRAPISLSSGRINELTMYSGGGIGGLAFAVILSRFAGPEIEVDVYEAAHEISTVGAGIALWPRTWQIFQELGLDKQLQAKLVEPPTWAESEPSSYLASG